MYSNGAVRFLVVVTFKSCIHSEVWSQKWCSSVKIILMNKVCKYHKRMIFSKNTTRAMLTSGLAYKNTPSPHRSVQSLCPQTCRQDFRKVVMSQPYSRCEKSPAELRWQRQCVMAAQACESWPIRADWALLGVAGLRETGAKMERSDRGWIEELQQ